MEAMVKKYVQKFRKVKDEMNRWDELQSRLLAQFRNTSSIIERLKCNSSLTSYLQKKSANLSYAVQETQKHSVNQNSLTIVRVKMAVSLFSAVETGKECLQRIFNDFIFGSR
ncbi:hypothetical protein L1049_026376 [Liquidambar formosana]|uniref:Uncharacterized protein n=1 Tax=Liquidambar formosana TaxID=63359 RepID=A0AAP0NEM5_LIQFO